LDGVIAWGIYYETEARKGSQCQKGIPNIGIGRGTIIRKAIIDQNPVSGWMQIGIDDIPRQEGISQCTPSMTALCASKCSH
jgi:glucose-1-phosphate adenylyltransferase